MYTSSATRHAAINNFRDDRLLFVFYDVMEQKRSCKSATRLVGSLLMAFQHSYFDGVLLTIKGAYTSDFSAASTLVQVGTVHVSQRCTRDPGRLMSNDDNGGGPASYACYVL